MAQVNALPSVGRLARYALLTAPILAVVHLGPVLLIGPDYQMFGVLRGVEPWQLFVGTGLIVLVIWTINALIARLAVRFELTGYVRLGFLVASSMVAIGGLLSALSLALEWTGNASASETSGTAYARMLAVNGVVLLILELLTMRESRIRELARADRAEIERLEAVQHNLLQQFQPHFLFNALATLQVLIPRDQERATAYAESLSAYMRDSIARGREPVVAVEDELRALERYVELQRTRFGEAIRFKLEVSPAARARSLPVFTLQLLAENAVKHNAFSATRPLTIEIFDAGPEALTVRNTVRARRDTPAPSGTGLRTLASRYELLGRRPPRVEPEGDRFAVTVELLAPVAAVGDGHFSAIGTHALTESAAAT